MTEEPLYDKIQAVIQAHLDPQNFLGHPHTSEMERATATFTIFRKGSPVDCSEESKKILNIRKIEAAFYRRLEADREL